jgi:hypothetical protein
MKTKLMAVAALLAGSTLFAAPRVVVGVGVGGPAYGYGYVAPAPVYMAPAPRVWVNGYWGFYGGRRVWHQGFYRPAPYRGFRR